MRDHWITKSSAYTAVPGDQILADTSSAAFTITLPASPVSGWSVQFADGGSDWSSNNLTIGRNSETIMGLSEDMAADITNASFTLVYNGSDWRLA